MAEIKFKLDEVTETYTVFEENQVLKSEQLNRVVEYLDDNSRLTKIELLGRGIVNGLIPTLSEKSIKISAGSAVTTDGDLLRFANDKTYEYFTDFNDNNAKYLLFKKGKSQITLYELHDKSSTVPGKKELSGLPRDILRNGVIVLYLESYLFDPDICTGSSCDNVGLEQRNNLKALIVRNSDLTNLLQTLPSFSACVEKIRGIKIKKVALQKEAVNSFNNLSGAYISSSERTVAEIEKILTSSFESCRGLAGEMWDGELPFMEWKNTIAKSLETVKKNKTGFQYFYDFIKDFVSALNEFADEVENNNYFGQPGAAAFPKHVCLGSFKTDNSNAYETYRHGTYPSRLIKNVNIKKLRFLFLRLHRMIINLNLTFANLKVSIYPERVCCPKLGEKVIPVYYNYDRHNPLNESWNYSYNVSNRNKEVLSFNITDYNTSDYAKDPLSYEYDDCKFFRIGGHINMTYEKAQAEIEGLIKKYNLPIKVMSLQVENDLTLIPSRPSKKFRDVRLLHKVYRQDLDRNLTNINSFNTRLVKQVDSVQEKPPTTTTDPKNSFKDYSVDKINNLGENITQLKTNLKKKTTEFNYQQFETNYKTALTKASTVNKSIKGVTFSHSTTPYEQMINQSKLNTLKWLDKIVEREVVKIKEMSVFEKFLEENPGMVHLGGVLWGGTFILIYSANSGKVIADFSLPYFYVEADKDDEIEEQVEEEDDPIKWTDVNDVIVDFDRTPFLKDKITSVESNFNIERGTLRQQIDAVSGKILSREEITRTLDQKLTEKETAIHASLNQKLTEKENSINNILSLKLAEKEAVINNAINQKINEKETVINSRFDQRLTEKENELKSNIDTKVAGFNSRFEDNKQVIELFSSNFGTLINTTASSIQSSTKSTKLDTTAKTNFENEEMEGLAAILDANAQYAEVLDRKEKAGTLTVAEKERKAQIEKTTNDTVVNLVKTMSEKGSDITSGSDEEKILLKAAESAAKMSSKTRTDMKKEVDKAKSGASDKTQLSKTLNKFNL